MRGTLLTRNDLVEIIQQRLSDNKFKPNIIPNASSNLQTSANITKFVHENGLIRVVHKNIQLYFWSDAAQSSEKFNHSSRRVPNRSIF